MGPLMLAPMGPLLERQYLSDQALATRWPPSTAISAPGVTVQTTIGLRKRRVGRGPKEGFSLRPDTEKGPTTVSTQAKLWRKP